MINFKIIFFITLTLVCECVFDCELSIENPLVTFVDIDTSPISGIPTLPFASTLISVCVPSLVWSVVESEFDTVCDRVDDMACAVESVNDLDCELGWR